MKHQQHFVVFSLALHLWAFLSSLFNQWSSIFLFHFHSNSFPILRFLSLVFIFFWCLQSIILEMCSIFSSTSSFIVFWMILRLRSFVFYHFTLMKSYYCFPFDFFGSGITFLSFAIFFFSRFDFYFSFYVHNKELFLIRTYDIWLVFL